MRTAAPRVMSAAVRDLGGVRAGDPGRVGMLSGGSDGERVEVVGQDRPGGPGSRAAMALEAGALEPVAAFEVADAALDAHPKAGEASVGAPGASGLAASDEHAGGA